MEYADVNWFIFTIESFNMERKHIYLSALYYTIAWWLYRYLAVVSSHDRFKAAIFVWLTSREDRLLIGGRQVQLVVNPRACESQRPHPHPPPTPPHPPAALLGIQLIYMSIWRLLRVKRYTVDYLTRTTLSHYYYRLQWAVYNIRKHEL